MSDKPADSSGAISADALKKAEEFIERGGGGGGGGEGGGRQQASYAGWLGYIGTGLAVVMSLFHLYAAYDIVPTYVLRWVHVGFVLVLVFLLFPISLRYRNRFAIWDVVFIAASIAVIYYLIAGGDDLVDRATTATSTDVVFGVDLRDPGPRSDATHHRLDHAGGGHLLHPYALFGPYLPPPWTHKGYEFDRLFGAALHDAGRHFRHRRRCLVEPDHPLHHLRRRAAVLGRR